MKRFTLEQLVPDTINFSIDNSTDTKELAVDSLYAAE